MGYSKNYSYLHVGDSYSGRDYVITTFYLEVKEGEDFMIIAEGVAAESSIGTWTDVAGLNQEVFDRLSAKVFEVKRTGKNSGVVKIAYPLALFETDNIPQIIASIAGNVFGLKEIENLRVKDVSFPDEFLKGLRGPAFGINGIRDLFQVYDRPLIGTIIKPKLGLSTRQHAQAAYEAWIGGVDIVKDDENLSDQDFNPFYERVTQTLEARRRAEDETGEKKLYCPNISARVGEMYARAKYVREMGGRAVMVDIITVGFSGVQFIRDQSMNLIIHGHRAMHGAFTNNDKHGISMLTIAKFARAAGIDQLHTGTVIGKMEGTRSEVANIHDFLKGHWGSLKPTMPIASGGLHPGHVHQLYEIMGKDVIINFGGGIHGHPDGTKAGAAAARQAVEAAVGGVSSREYAKNHGELSRALDKWGTGTSEEILLEKDTYLYPLIVSDGLKLTKKHSSS
nr:RuBisCO long chain, Form III-c [uncultured bacterium]